MCFCNIFHTSLAGRGLKMQRFFFVSSRIVLVNKARLLVNSCDCVVIVRCCCLLLEGV